MSEFLLETKNLIVGYGKTKVVRDVNFGVKAGEIVSLIGPNGAGKTTLLKSVCGILEPLGGEVFIKGTDIKKIKKDELSKIVAVSFTDGMVKESISCFDFVAMGRYPYTGFLGKLEEEDIDIVNDSMRKTDVHSLRDSDFTRLSDGQKQRVILARALAQKPKLLILDEPTTYLDIRFKLEFLSLLYSLAKKENFAVIMSLHELDMARQISDKIICIKGDYIDKIAGPEDIFSEGYIEKLFDISIGSFEEENSRAFISKER